MKSPQSLRKLLTLAAGALLFGVLTSGCARHVHRHHVHPHKAQVVVIKKGHVHNARCGHYRHKGQWYLVKGHAHKRGCGHRHVKGVWVIQ